ncbi:MAG: coagulation factor 5/8 type domain-containing protein [Acidobacteriota bacterium]
MSGNLLITALLCLGASSALFAADLLDPAAWRALPSDGVSLAIAADGQPGQPALRLDYDFHGKAGWAAARRSLDIELPATWELRFDLRGEGPPNHLEVKLLDAHENVYWHVLRNVAWPKAAETVRVKERQVAFAWGPDSGAPPPLRRIAELELTVTAATGGHGTVWISNLEVVPRQEPSASPKALDLTKSSPNEKGEQEIAIDLGGLTELGGLTLRWEPGRAPGRVALEISEDGSTFRPVREAEPRGAARTDFYLPESEARALRLHLREPGPKGFGIAGAEIRPLSVGASRNAFVSMLASEVPRGAYPRAFLNEQSYWTVVGVDKDPVEMLVSEDGTIELTELAERYSLEPFVRLNEPNGRLITWANSSITQSLAEGDLPIPTVTWEFPADHPALRLSITALATPVPGGSALLARYHLANLSTTRRTGTLQLAARPFQVNPPQQFLNDPGGVSRLSHLAGDEHGLAIEGEPSLFVSPAAKFGAMTFDEGSPFERLAAGTLPRRTEVNDPEAQATGILAWPFDLAPGASLEVIAAGGSNPEARGAAAKIAAGGGERFAALEREVSANWRQRLSRVGLDLPPAAAPIARAIRSSLAWVLIHRDGPALQPGSRAYARSWIRDGALTGVALLRLGEVDTAREFVEWFSGFQSADGTVPCCVDKRGADSVPEHDSHGELIHLITEVYRYGKDRAWAEKMLPVVARAVDHLEALRQSRRTEDWKGKDAFGLLPESISHEGYSAKAVHSYWDDFFAYRGLEDAVDLAHALGHEDFAAKWGARRDEFRADLLASIEHTRERAKIAYIPGSEDLADFDSTATTIALDPAGLEGYLPKAALDATFERFYAELSARRSGAKEWEIYTPYEIRHIGAFLRLGWKERALSALDFYLADRRPVPWNQWPEVVSRDPRQAHFIGDLPHGWVATDFVRSALDLFAYERRGDHSLVLAAGVSAAWLDRPEGIAVRDLRTPWGTLTYRLARRGTGVHYEIAEKGLELPPGGLVLSWPLEGRAGGVWVDGKPAAIGPDGTFTLRQLPAMVDLQLEGKGLYR